MVQVSQAERWPALPAANWRDTRETLHLWTQVIGKIRLTQTPWLNHSWHVALYVTARGLTTGPMPDGGRSLQIDFDFIDHVLRLSSSDRQTRELPLKPMAVEGFYAAVIEALVALGFDIRITTMPCEIADAIPFDRDRTHASYDADYANRFWRVLLSAHEAMSEFRTAFLGKASPVHFFWGSFDLAVTRFSGRRAPPHPGGVPHLPNSVAREAYSHEVSSAGFWPGGGGPMEEAAFYSYAYPAPEGFSAAKVRPDAAYFSTELGEFLLPYEAMRNARDPDQALMDFLTSTYDAAADLAKWDRAALECAMGEAGKCRVV